MPPLTQQPAHICPLGIEGVAALIDEHFPQVYEGDGGLSIQAVSLNDARVRLIHAASMIRPGGTTSGPTMFKLADFSIYVAVLATYGAGALQAVTTTLTMNFLSRPAPGDLFAHARLLRAGRRLAVAEVEIAAETGDLVAHATGTYALPPDLAAAAHESPGS